MEATNYTSIGPVLQLNKAGELTQKRMKVVKVCDGLYISKPDKNGYTSFICELKGVLWLDCKAAESKIAYGIKMIPGYFEQIKAGYFDGENIQEFKREISRRINHPDSPAIMELKKPERKKSAPLAENERKVSVLMFKGCTDETIEKKVVIIEVAPHIYTYAYKMKRYGERVKVIFEIDGVYFQGSDNGAYVLEREGFTEVCTKAYEHARKNIADGAAKGMAYFIEVQKRIDAATPSETSRISTETAETVNVSAEGENEPQAAKYKPYTTRAEIIALLESEHGIEYDAGEVVYLKDGCVAEDLSDEGEWRIYLDADSDKCIDVIAIQPPQSPETPQAGECPTNTPKPRETARKRPNRAIGSAQAARRNTLRDTLRSVTHVPRECSTTEASYW